ncbi:MAG: hypothetical protein AB7H96_13050 [Vicinamibacterales bacterium]
MFKLVRLCAALALAASLAACGGVSSPSNQTAEDFTGTLGQSSQAFQTFSVSRTGELSMTLQSLTPRPVVGFVSLGIGTPGAGSCSPLLGYIISQAAIGTPYSFPRIINGTYCIVVADANAILTGPTNFAIRFTHP